ncbi:MAG: hypothetical protein ACI9S8_000595 [Chlamydiales bacterium]|jgi:hypothetical protein
MLVDKSRISKKEERQKKAAILWPPKTPKEIKTKQ